jgi:hypothetical protein
VRESGPSRFAMLVGIRTRLPRTLRVAAIVLLALAGGPSFADSVDDAIAQIQALEKSGDFAKCVSKIRELKDSNDPRVVAAIRDLEKSENDDVACAAIRFCALHKDPKALEWLRSKIDDEPLFKEKGGRQELYRCVLESVALYKDPGSSKPLEGVVKTFLATNSELTVPAIHAYASVRQKSVISQLITWLGQLEAHHGGKSSGGSGGQGKYSPETQKIRDASTAAMIDALCDLTDEDLGEYANWKKWWADHASTFEFPTADTADANVDVSSLEEWTDTRYGYAIKRPEGPGWKFKPRDSQFRIQVLKADDQGRWMGFVGWNVYRTAVSTIKDVKGYTDWWVSTQFPKFEFQSYSPGGDPVVEQKSFAGREWTVITANGLGKEGTPMATWGPMEHRVYFTKIGCGFVYAWGIVRTTTSPDDKQKTWNIIEGAVMTK